MPSRSSEESKNGATAKCQRTKVLVFANNIRKPSHYYYSHVSHQEFLSDFIRQEEEV